MKILSVPNMRSKSNAASARSFLGAVHNVPFPPAREVTADAWTAIAAAVQADRQQAHARVDAIVEALIRQPRKRAALTPPPPDRENARVARIAA
jgi:hypothetical protein